MNNKLIILVSIAVFFGLLSGVVGQIVSRAYFLEKDFNIPLFRDISFDNDNNSANLIISNPKKIVVEQTAKVAETAQAVRGGIMGIFQKNNKEKKYIDFREKSGQAFVVTSDGWMISAFTPEEILNIKNREATSSRKKILKIAENYIFISADSKVYKVENILYDSLSGFSFWKIKAHDLPVRKLESFSKNGELVFGLNWAGDILTTTILGKKKDAQILSSDIFIEEILISDKIDSALNNSFLFNTYGDLIGLITDNQKIISIKSLNSLIQNLLKNQSIKRPSLGINYINYFNVLDLEENKIGFGAKISKDKKGLAILKKSPAEVAGLKEGDVITSINKTNLTKDINLREIINNYLPGDDLNIAYLRDGKNFSVNLKLGRF